MTTSPIRAIIQRHRRAEIKPKTASNFSTKGGKGDSLGLPNELYTALYALYALYGHYEKTYEEWSRAGIPVPPVFVVVCSNTSTSELV